MPIPIITDCSSNRPDVWPLHRYSFNVNPSISPLIHSSMHKSIHPCTNPFIHPCTNPPIHLFFQLSNHLFSFPSFTHSSNPTHSFILPHPLIHPCIHQSIPSTYSYNLHS